VNMRVNRGDDATAGGLPARPSRRAVHLSGIAILNDRQTAEVTVLDLTYDGCCIEAADALTVGQTIKLSVPGLGAIDAQVRWCKGSKFGLAFSPAPEKPREIRPRAAERLAVDAEVMQRRHGHPNYRVRLSDVSRTGCKADFVERPRVGDHVWIKFEGLESLDAEVCWAEGFHAGLKFVNPIHPAVFDLLAKRLGD